MNATRFLLFVTLFSCIAPNNRTKHSVTHTHTHTHTHARTHTNTHTHTPIHCIFSHTNQQRMTDYTGGWRIGPEDDRSHRRMTDHTGGWQITPEDDRSHRQMTYRTHNKRWIKWNFNGFIWLNLCPEDQLYSCYYMKKMLGDKGCLIHQCIQQQHSIHHTQSLTDTTWGLHISTIIFSSITL